MQNRRWIDCHNHTHYSNLRIIDAICKPETLIQRAKEIGLRGICFTEHECLSESIEICELRDKYPDIKLGIGNEIYLTDTRDKNQKYYHFILIAKDKIGHRQLRELSSRAWMNSYFDRGIERVPTTKEELTEIVSKDKGHLIATCACLGSESSIAILDMEKARRSQDKEQEINSYNQIVKYFTYCKDLFGDDFYIELPPGASKEQIIVNNKLYQISKVFNIKCEISCDSHYLKKEDRYIHKAFLNSKDGEREVDSFYEYSYLQDENDIIEHLKASFGELAEQIYNECCETSEEIFSKITEYDLRHPQTIPHVDIKDYPKQEKIELKNWKNLYSMFSSDNKTERCWINECYDSLKRKESEGKIKAESENKYLDELEKEADIKRTVGARLGTNIFNYPLVLKHYIDLIWDMGSTIGAGRGSAGAGLNHWLLGITQYDPVALHLPFERYMNWDTMGLPDVDFDLCPSKRPAIIQKVKEERGQKFNSNIDELSKKNLGCTLIATFGTASSKRAVQIACKGYRSEEFPDGIDIDTSQYLSSLIGQERGFVWSISDTYYGNKEKGREPSAIFKQEVDSYPGLLDIILGVEGLIVSRSSHASGIILFDEDPYQFGCFMKTPSGDIITQYDLGACEAAGMTKYDWLLTSIQDKFVKTIQLLQEHNEIDPNLTLRQVYDKYLSPEALNFNDPDIWNKIDEGNILDLFQFDSDVGRQGIKLVKPRSLDDLSNTNGIIRLMAKEGEERPLDKFVRYKNNINLWYQEMQKSGLTEKEQKVMEKYLKKSYGLGISQECIMWSLMDPDICGFTLAESNKARKIISKKKMDKIPALREKVMASAKTPEIGKYEWTYVIGPSLGYGFSDIHSIFYSMIGFQSAYIATNWNPIYWDTACLIVDSGSLEDSDKDNTDYGKLAKALGKIIDAGVKISLIDINKSNYGFEPDVNNNQILFGMKALSGISASTIDQIISGRPYYNLKDFMIRCPLNKTAMISLIKSGAFDNLESTWAKSLNVEPRILVMTYYLSKVCNPKTKLTLQNFNGLLQYNLIPSKFDKEKSIYLLNKKLKENKKGNYYLIPLDLINNNLIDAENIEIIDGISCINQKKWDKDYKNKIEPIRLWLKDNQDEVLKQYNILLFKEMWDKYAKGNISAWEMESLCFYYHQHELENVDNKKYGIVDFNMLPQEPEIDRVFKKGGREIPIYKLHKIAGTVISKNDTRHSIFLLTTTGVVNVKFTKDYYALFGRQISEIQPDGSKKVMEKGWMTRGAKLLITGIRREDTFLSKNYKSKGGHQLYKIVDVKPNGDIEITHTRWGQDIE